MKILLLVILLTFDWIEVSKFKSNGFDDITNRNLKNDICKESVGKADIVQVCDLDEVIWVVNSKL